MRRLLPSETRTEWADSTGAVVLATDALEPAWPSILVDLETMLGTGALNGDAAANVTQPDQAPADEGIVPWFYRTLRNAAIDV